MELLQLLCSAGNLLPTTKHQLYKFAHKFKCPYSRIDYCRSCQQTLPTSRRCIVGTCLKREPNSLIVFNPKRTLLQTITNNWTKMESHDLTKRKIIGITFNTDGISPFKSSRTTIWPIFLVIANLPPAVRMLKQNVITCMLWIGNCKPDMQFFLNQFKKVIMHP